jgi:hypothetical protein
MEINEEKGRRNHVIQKIKRISMAIDQGDTWNVLLVVGLGVAVITAIVLYLFL